MSLQSDITIDASKFDPKSITNATHALNGHLMDMMKGAPKWYEVPPERPDPSVQPIALIGVYAGRRREIPANACKRRDTVSAASGGRVRQAVLHT